MSKEWTTKRQRACRRDSKGRFRLWVGGYDKSELPKQRNNYHGIRVHIGHEFKKQFGRAPRIGDIVRFKTKSGNYHQQAAWYVYTRFGWRDSKSPARPSASKIKSICANARKSRSRR